MKYTTGFAGVHQTEDGNKLIDPGKYDLGEGRHLYVFLTGRQGDDLRAWACTDAHHDAQEWMLCCPQCQEVDGMLNACLLNVADAPFCKRP